MPVRRGGDAVSAIRKCVLTLQMTIPLIRLPKALHEVDVDKLHTWLVNGLREDFARDEDQL